MLRTALKQKMNTSKMPESRFEIFTQFRLEVWYYLNWKNGRKVLFNHFSFFLNSACSCFSALGIKKYMWSNRSRSKTGIFDTL